MSEGKCYLVTGGTGFLGSRLVWALTRDGHEVWMLNRTEPAPPMQSHMATLMGLFGGTRRANRPIPQWLPGNIWLPLCGVSPEWIEKHRGKIDAVIHMAADTRLRPVRVDDQRRTNVDGTANAIDLTKALDCDCFHHVSACSVAGSLRGIFYESELDRGQDYRSSVEETKAEGERLVRRRTKEEDIHLTVHRPATLVGDSVTGGAATFPPFYQLLSAWWRFAARDSDGTVTVPFSAGAAIPLVPVDHVAEGILASLGEQCDGGITYHWAPRNALSLGALNECLARLLETDPLEFDPDEPWPIAGEDGPSQPLWEWLRAHRPYLYGGLEFDRTNADALCVRHDLPVPEVNEELLGKLHRHWAWATKRV